MTNQSQTLPTQIDATNQPDSQNENQADLSLNEHHHYDLSTKTYVPINNAGTVNIPSPAIPANDMVLLEHHYPGAIDRILKMSEKEQDFAHQLAQQQQNEQVKINDRNIQISKEQNIFNITKLGMGFIVIILLGGIDAVLFSHGFDVGGGIMTFATLVLAAIFILGYFPESIFSIFKRGNDSSE